MELLVTLLIIVVAIAPFISIISAIVGGSRLKAMRERIEALQREVDTLRAKVRTISEPIAAPPPAAQSEPEAKAEAPEPAGWAEEPAQDVRPGVFIEPATPAREFVEPETWRPKTPPPIPPTALEPLAQPTLEPPAQPATPFDWEALLGVRGAAWVGAIALVIAFTLFAKWAIDRNLITPGLRIGIILASGFAAIVGAEFMLRKGYETTANALSGAGVAVLYAGLYAAHAIYDLIGVFPAFGGMALVTAVACVLAIRHDALFIAVLGLLGGFATPLILSTGEDRPVGLFSYILLLDVGILWIAVRKGWNILALLSLVGTFLIECLWFGRFMTPEKMALGAGIFTLFAILYLALPAIAGQKDHKKDQSLLRGAMLGGLAPFVFAFFMAGRPEFTGQWPSLFGFISFIDIALAVVAVRRGQSFLVLSGAVATVLTMLLWGWHGLGAENLWGPCLSVMAICLSFNAVPSLARRFAREIHESEQRILKTAALAAGMGLFLFTLLLIERNPNPPLWIFAALAAGMSLIVLERSRGEWLREEIATAGPLAIAVAAQIWFIKSANPIFPLAMGAGELTRFLSVPLLLAVAWTLIAALRQRAKGDLPEKTANAHTAGAVGTAVVAIAGLFLCAVSPRLGANPGPIFGSLALLCILLIGSSLRRGWTPLLLLAVFAAAALANFWFDARFMSVDWLPVLSIDGAFYLAFLALPFAMPRKLAPGWLGSPWPWLSAALAGPLFFWAIYHASVAGWGKDYIGALPLVMAVFSGAALAGIKRRYPAMPQDPLMQLQRLRNLALYTLLALGMVALAIPLQLHHQWITLGWALVGMVAWGIYRPLPHPGLKYFGLALYLAVNARLLLNPMVLRYAERGWPVLNWILYTYGVAALACLGGAALLRPVEAERMTPGEAAFFKGGKFGLAQLVGFLSLILIFALINLEIADYFSRGRYLEIEWTHLYARDLTTSLAWGIYGLTLLIVGMWRRMKPLRFISLGFVLLTVAKVFLYDLSSLQGLYRVISFLGLAAATILVSLLYQRFVFRKTPREGTTAG